MHYNGDVLALKTRGRRAAHSGNGQKRAVQAAAIAARPKSQIVTREFLAGQVKEMHAIQARIDARKARKGSNL